MKKDKEKFNSGIRVFLFFMFLLTVIFLMIVSSSGGKGQHLSLKNYFIVHYKGHIYQCKKGYTFDRNDLTCKKSYRAEVIK